MYASCREVVSDVLLDVELKSYGFGNVMCLEVISDIEKCLQGNEEIACSLFDTALELEKFKEDTRALAVVYIQYARFLDQVSIHI